MSKENIDVLDLEIESIIGFDGMTINGLQVHPDGIHIVYPLGNKVCIQNWKTKSQGFLTGHTNIISALDISPNGKYVASGQINYMGFKACVILWDFETHAVLARHEIHKVRVESVIFSCDNAFLVSLGGRDDSNIVVWDVEGNEAICGSVASGGTAGDALVLYPTARRGVCFLSGGENTLRVWRINPTKRHVLAMDVKFGMIKRNITCIVVDERDEHAYCGSTTGDIIKARLNYDCDATILDPVMTPVLLGCYGKFPKKKTINGDPTERYSKGVTALVLLSDDLQNRMVVAAGDGTVELVKERSGKHQDPTGRLRMPSVPQIDALKRTKVDGGVTSLNIMGGHILAGTMNCEIYTINLDTFEVILHVTCHTHAIFDIAFPFEFSDVFATCSKNDIRVWNSDTCKELLRISVPNFTCSSVVFTHDGKSIISGWNDGVIRAFTPQTGRLMYAIHNAHSKGVSAIKITTCDKTIISGGVEGEVRIWDIKPTYQNLMGILKEHRAPVTAISLSHNNMQAISASTDGTCIIWDLVRQVRSQVLFANTQFMCAAFFPSSVQILTVGTDRKIGYWEVFDGSLIRELEGSKCTALNTLDISSDGNVFATGGCDQYVKFWNYKEGITSHIGIGHAAIVTAVRFSPDDRHIVSVSADGAIFRWKCPYEEPQETLDGASTRTLVTSSRSSCSVSGNNAQQQKLQSDEENIHQSKEGTPKSTGSKKNSNSAKSQPSMKSVVSLPPSNRKINTKVESEENLKGPYEEAQTKPKSSTRSHTSSKESVRSSIVSVNGKGDKSVCLCHHDKGTRRHNSSSSHNNKHT